MSPTSEPSPEVEITGDFTGQQFNSNAVSDKVREQYGEEHARVFYQHVMGGGGLDIHYGIFRSPTDGVYEASKATNRFLKQQLDWVNPIFSGKKGVFISHPGSGGQVDNEQLHSSPLECEILDLGAGTGGLSHEMALEFGCKVVSFNLCDTQNEMNRIAAGKLGLGAERLEIIQGNFNEGLPTGWTGRFSHIVSCEVLCHAGNKRSLMKELLRVMKPSGALVFTDIMGADNISESLLKDFTDRNATTAMARPSEYLQLLKDVGFENVSFWDGSQHLEHYFHAMMRVCITERKAMIEKGVPAGYLDNWERSLSERCKIQREKGVFAWGVMSARKSGEVVSKKSVVVIPRIEEMKKTDVIECFRDRLGSMKGVADFYIAGKLEEVPVEILEKSEILFTSWGHHPEALKEFEKHMPKLKWVHLLTVGMSPTILQSLEDKTAEKREKLIASKLLNGASNSSISTLNSESNPEILRAKSESSENGSTPCSSPKLEKNTTPQLSAHEFVVTTGKGSFSEPIAEYVLASVLHFKKNLPQVLDQQSKKLWKAPEKMVEMGKGHTTVGLVGYGSIGKAIGRAFLGLGSRVWYTNSQTAPAWEDVDQDQAQNEPQHVSLCRLLRDADVIVCSLPETHVTKNFFNEAAFGSMKENCVFVNVGRGSVVDENALLKHAKKFRGIILDVFAMEPLPKKSKLWELDNVLLTPHCLVFSNRFCDNVMDRFRSLLGEFLNGGKGEKFIEAEFCLEKGY